MKSINKNNPPPILQKIYKELETGALSLGLNPFDTLIKADYIDKETEAKTQTKNDVQRALANEQGWICCYCNKEITESNGQIEMKIEHYKPESIYDGQKMLGTQQLQKLCPNNRKQAELPDFRIDYENLLCACKGQHCDDSTFGKNDWELCSIANPSKVLERDFQRTYEIYYSNEGYIYSKKRCNNTLLEDSMCKCSCNNDEAKRDCLNWELGGCKKADGKFVQGRLNLNASSLKDARKAAWSSVLREIISEVLRLRPSDYKLEQFDWRAKLKNKKIEANLEAQRLLEKYSQRRKRDDKFYPFCMYVVYRLKKEFDL